MLANAAQGTNLIVGSENALPADRQFELMEQVGCDNLRLYFDTRNLWQMKGIESASVLAAVYDHVCETHLKDGTDNGPWMPLGEGNSGFQGCMTVLKERGYGGWLVLENGYADIAGRTGMSVEDAIKQDIAIICSWSD